jgi:hypothetical protein
MHGEPLLAFQSLFDLRMIGIMRLAAFLNFARRPKANCKIRRTGL